MSGSMALPPIIQGGMGVAISGWTLARAVAAQGQMGVVSGTGLDTVFVRRLQDGDVGGHLRRAMEHFPIPQAVEEALEFFRPEGREEGEPYALLPMYGHLVDSARHRLTSLANFVEVRLAKSGVPGPVGINLLTKIQTPTLASLYGAILAGVDFVLMGAGIPREIPGALDRLARHESASLSLDMPGSEGEQLLLDPRELSGGRTVSESDRPRFLPIVASNSLATVLARKANGRVDGFVIEGPTAGGHNAPPRGAKTLNDRGEPVYGDRDLVDLEKIADLGLPFWVAGGAGHPGRIEEVRTHGGEGVQVGTLFAFCQESGLDETHRRAILSQAGNGTVDVMTEDRASPTGFPFKAVQLQGTLSDEGVYRARERVCDLGYLRTPYRKPAGGIGFRCPAEPEDTFLKKGGAAEELPGRKCLCNALMSTAGLAQVREGRPGNEPAYLTGGDDLRVLGSFLAGRTSYTVADVIQYLLPENESAV
jgi:nitronate monooxygenase